MPDESKPAIGLADAIGAVRDDLIQAQQQGAGEDVRFTVGDVELEFAVDVTREAGAEASVKVLSVLSVGGKGGVAHKQGHRVKVVLKPRTVDGQPMEVAHAQRGRPGG
jgi:hypothetical protein